MEKKSFLTVGIICLIVAGIWGRTKEIRPASARTADKLPIYSVETEEKVVAVTFDSAWGTEDLDEILRILGKYKATAAFFVTGEFVSANPDAVKKLEEAGHDLGNHGDNHKKMSQLSKEECRQEIQNLHTKVKNLTGKEMWLFRPPYGDYTDTVLEAAEDCGYLAVQWDVDSLDWKDYGAEDIVRRVNEHKNLRNGSIILLHTGTKYTARALDEMLAGLETEGYRFVSLSELLLRENYSIDHEGRQHTDTNA